MSSETTQTTIANRALQLLGSKPIGSLTENSVGAKAINRAYFPVLFKLLRANFWGFSIKRATLAATATQPTFGKANYFPLPADFLMLAPPDQTSAYAIGAIPLTPSSGPYTGFQYNDWQIENFNGQLVIATDMDAPLYIRYVSKDVTPAIFDPSFAEALAADLAMNCCEELTNSNSKLQNAESIYDMAMQEAKQRGAFEQQPVRPPVEPWILARL